MEMTAQTPKGFSGTYRSAGTRARITSILLAVVGVVTLVSLVHEASGFGLIDDARAGTLATAEANAFDTTTFGLAVVYLASLVVTAIAYLAWLSRTVDNVPALGGGTPSVTPAWSVGWWFVPFVNLVRPYLIVREVHDRMATTALAGGGWIVVAWWLTWIVANVLSNLASRLPDPNSLEALRNLFSIEVGADVLGVIAAVLAIVVVRRIQSRAEERAASQPPPSPEPTAIDAPQVDGGATDGR
jgi:hypothetical protein